MLGEFPIRSNRSSSRVQVILNPNNFQDIHFILLYLDKPIVTFDPEYMQKCLLKQDQFRFSYQSCLMSLQALLNHFTVL